ncbi:MAG: hypothetical protein ACOC0W_08215 [Desulfosalsimonas sp.]
MNTEHRLYFTDSRLLDALDNCSIDLVVTSPPYPMISMWDQVFSGLDGSIENLLSQARGRTLPGDQARRIRVCKHR